MNRLRPSIGQSLQRTVTAMVWDALREQQTAPTEFAYRNLQSARIKAYIESQLADPDLCVDAIAQACDISVRSVHRAFDADSSGSVSTYVWTRRISQCAAALRDPAQAERSISDICFAWGFNSTSHFSRVFKDQFGIPPRSYRLSGARPNLRDGSGRLVESGETDVTRYRAPESREVARWGSRTTAAPPIVAAYIGPATSH
jgi:AraC-like DNA-binding protein